MTSRPQSNVQPGTDFTTIWAVELFINYIRMIAYWPKYTQFWDKLGQYINIIYSAKFMIYILQELSTAKIVPHKHIRCMHTCCGQCVPLFRSSKWCIQCVLFWYSKHK